MKAVVVVFLIWSHPVVVLVLIVLVFLLLALVVALAVQSGQGGHRGTWHKELTSSSSPPQPLLPTASPKQGHNRPQVPPVLEASLSSTVEGGEERRGEERRGEERRGEERRGEERRGEERRGEERRGEERRGEERRGEERRGEERRGEERRGEERLLLSPKKHAKKKGPMPVKLLKNCSPGESASGGLNRPRWLLQPVEGQGKTHHGAGSGWCVAVLRVTRVFEFRQIK
ncbi:hypothetical protein DUI87_11972 [Hirundo rustica rustica]|uniref:Uncharacterized protein n=1 Tax=Hirundo rustica rustica TaxID=333673 RepID=A0A3M0KFB9_HIRRU|nr:hypothetical protein DUI87_11972 [Hirundo rustica rustica]